MFINHVKESLQYITKVGLTPMLMGEHGIGKTEVVRQFAEENGYSFIDLRLGTQEPGDLLGLQDIEKDSEGNVLNTTFAKPKWFPTEGKHLIFLDEINRAPKYVLQAVFQLILDKRIHTHVLPEDCLVVAAANPDTDDFSVTDMSDKALLDRFCFIKVEKNKDVWIDYATNKGVDGSIISFIGEQDNYLSGQSQDFDLGELVTPSPRTWFFVDKLSKLNPPESVLKGLLEGMIGPAATLAYITHKDNYEKKFNPELILYDYKKFKPELKKLLENETVRFDLINALNKDLVSKLDQIIENHLEIDVEKIVDTNTIYQIKDEKVLKNLKSYIKDLPIESAVNLLNVISRHENGLIKAGLTNYLSDDDVILNRLKKQKEKADSLIDKKEEKEENA